ncbi:hypothetical protein JXQ31_19880 [candidate division KSB1 bacterium]|nr:hypothetical protein [candidate division KSB1 bacterium]
MQTNKKTHEKNGENLHEILYRLEARIARIEEYLRLPSAVQPTPGKVKAKADTIQSIDESLEFRIGEYWLAQVGAVIVLMGIAFFISYPIPGIPALIASFLGYIAVAGLLGLSHFWHKEYLYLSNILFGGGLVLLYFATLRLHFFSPHPVITNELAGLLLLVIVLSIILYITVKRQSVAITGITIFLCYTSSLFSIYAHFTLIFITVTTIVSIYLLVKYNWHSIAILALIMVFLTHLLWLFNNPVLGNSIKPVSAHHYNLVYLVIYGAMFGLCNIIRDKNSYSDFFEIILTGFNGLGIFMIGGVNILNYFKPQTSLFGFLTFIFFFILAVLNWKRTKSNYSTAYYSCFAFIALSFAIFAQFEYPDYFIWLGLQSLLVIITALWFRSKIIIIANIIIYLLIFVIYFRFSASDNWVNLSYALTALISARVLNWKKQRLKLKTDLIRNIYLACAFIIILYGLYHAIPAKFISLSWTGAALFYFIMNIILKNIKYRWMAILTIFATVVYIILIDMSRLSAGFRIILFLAVGFSILLLSFYYTRFRKKLSKQDVEEK